MTRALLLAFTGLALIILSLTAPVAHPGIGLAVGSVLLLIGGSVLVRKWPKSEEDDDVQRQIDNQ